MDNPFEIILNKLAQLEARQNELIALYRAPIAPIIAPPVEEYPLTVEDAAKLFGITKQTLYQNKNKIKHTKQFGRLYFYASDLRAYVNEGFIYKGERAI